MIARLLAGLALVAGFAPAAASVDWQQAGGSMGKVPTQAGIVGQGYETPEISGAGTVVQSGFLAHPLLVNSAPFVASPLGSRQLDASSSPVRIGLGAVFADFDGDTLDFRAWNAGEIVQAGISGDSLIVAGRGIVGQEAIVVTASDGVRTAVDTLLIEIQATTAIRQPSSRKRASHALEARLPAVFAHAVEGAAPGSLSPDPLAADAEGLALEILLPGPGRVEVAIHDNLGVPVIRFEREVTASMLAAIPRDADGRRPYVLRWNLRSAQGTPVPAGVYLWQIEAATADGQKLETVRRTGVRGRP